MKKLLLILCFAALFTACNTKQKPQPEFDSSDFVAITDVVPDAILEIRYYSTYNFVGARIDCKSFHPLGKGFTGYHYEAHLLSHG